MLKNILTYILLVAAAALTATSCADSLFVEDPAGGNVPGVEIRGTISFGLSTPDVAVRSRSVSTQSGASLLVKNLWVGVFNTTTGECFGAKKYGELNQTMRSGVVQNDIIKVDFIARDGEIPQAYIVAVANYDDVRTWDGRALDGLLPDFDDRASITWHDVINLDIDTQSAYAGNKGEDENSTAPFLAGYFQDAVSLTQNPKIDQFDYDEVGPTAIYPASAASGMDIMLGDASSNDVYVAAGALCLRRLVSHNTVKLNMSNGFEVVSASYKRHNMPKTVFMLQRRTDTNRHDSFAEWQKYSPNRADQLLAEGNYDDTSGAFPYASDKEWIALSEDALKDKENVEFVFDHFENKHWGFGTLESQGDRERRNPDGTFAALCRGPEDAYNNFASYFELKLHIINRQTGESADVEYTLHEGFCNTDDGRRASTLAEACHDFGSFRNVNYTYNVNISGVDDITASVTGDDAGLSQHPVGQSGRIWRMFFATGKSKTPVPIGGGTYDFSGDYMTFSDNPDLGFRIYGLDLDGQVLDVCYNMPEGMYEGFAGLWPTAQAVNVAKGDMVTLGRLIPTKLLEGMKFGAGGSQYNVIELMRGVENGTLSATEKYNVTFTDYDGKAEGLQGNFMRAVYVFDRNDVRNATDADGCSTYNVAYGGEQYPFLSEKIRFNPDNILWDNSDYYKNASRRTDASGVVRTAASVVSASKAIFYGAECSKVDLRWKHDSRFQGYRIQVYNANYTHPTVTVSPSELPRYLHEVNGETVFVYPLNTANFPRSATTGANNYSFTVTPIADESMYEIEGPTDIVHNTTNDDTCIRVCPTMWDFASTTDWKAVNIGTNATIQVFLRGLSISSLIDPTTSQYATAGKYVCFGGPGSVSGRYFSFWVAVPGKLTVTARSNSSATDRPVVIAKMHDGGASVTTWGEPYDQVYSSGTIVGSSATAAAYTTTVTPQNGELTEYRIYSPGSIQFYKIQFTPN